MTKLRLDDLRDPRVELPRQVPDRIWDEDAFTPWRWAKTESEAIAILEKGDVDEASFDHDLGEADAGTGMKVLDWIEEHTATDPTFEPPREMRVHSANAAMWSQMELVIDRIRSWRTRRVEGGNIERP
jgi:hypothetical protein